MSDHIQRAEKVLSRINELAGISEDEEGITRIYGTKAFIEGRNKVEEWMKNDGLLTRVDNIGNIRGRLLSKNVNAKTFVIASHIDTIINAGRFDGPLGVLMGLDVVGYLIQAKCELPFHIELIGFCDEEGCRFHTTFLGSKAVAGCFDTSLLDAKDEAGISLLEVIEENKGDAGKCNDDRIAKEDWLGYYEIHIEQGPVLYERNIPVGIVKAIAGQRRASIVFKGEAGHAGTVPMYMRKDALAAAAEFILQVEKFAKANSADLVATIGKLHVINSASNVIPGEVAISLDIRSADNNRLSDCYREIKNKADLICKKRNIGLEWNLIQESESLECDASLIGLLSESVKESGYDVLELVSGAGHDAIPVSDVSPVAMLFVKCFKGISHNPLENVELKDLEAAIKVSDNFIKQLITHNS